MKGRKDDQEKRKENMCCHQIILISSRKIIQKKETDPEASVVACGGRRVLRRGGTARRCEVGHRTPREIPQCPSVASAKKGLVVHFCRLSVLEPVSCATWTSSFSAKAPRAVASLCHGERGELLGEKETVKGRREQAEREDDNNSKELRLLQQEEEEMRWGWVKSLQVRSLEAPGGALCPLPIINKGRIFP